jgi:S-formylglutathione hydrolase FrmB
LLVVLPECGRRWFINDVAGYHYEDYLVDELVPAIDGTFPTDPQAEARSIGGFSMGGASAVYIALRHPELFSAAFAYAGAFYASRREGDPYQAYRCSGIMMPTEAEHNRVWGGAGSAVRRIYDPDEIIKNAVLNDRKPRLILEVGLDDYQRVVEQNRIMHAAIHTAGFEHSYRECCGDHSWASALASVKRALRCWRKCSGGLSGTARPCSEVGALGEL